MLLRLPDTHARRQTSASARTNLPPPQPVAMTDWPKRPSPGVLSKSIPLFFISRDSDGFWIACEAEFRIGGIFLFQRSALHFAQRCSEPTRCATMFLSEPHNLGIENRGNRFAARLRPVMRLVRRLTAKLNVFARTTIAKLRLVGRRMSRAYIEDQMLRAALEVKLYRNRYKHSNKNDDDLPIVR
jgi:hypothetical protein